MCVCSIYVCVCSSYVYLHICVCLFVCSVYVRIMYVYSVYVCVGMYCCVYVCLLWHKWPSTHIKRSENNC